MVGIVPAIVAFNRTARSARAEIFVSTHAEKTENSFGALVKDVATFRMTVGHRGAVLRAELRLLRINLSVAPPTRQRPGFV